MKTGVTASSQLLKDKKGIDRKPSRFFKGKTSNILGKGRWLVEVNGESRKGFLKTYFLSECPLIVESSTVSQNWIVSERINVHVCVTVKPTSRHNRRVKDYKGRYFSAANLMTEELQKRRNPKRKFKRGYRIAVIHCWPLDNIAKRYWMFLLYPKSESFERIGWNGVKHFGGSNTGEKELFNV